MQTNLIQALLRDRGIQSIGPPSTEHFNFILFVYVFLSLGIHVFLVEYEL